MKPYRTILIDDHQLFSDGLKNILNDTSTFRVVAQVFDSRQSGAACFTHQPDLVLVDLNMPHLDGVAVVQQIQQLAFRCRIVVVSMYAEKSEITRFSALNVDGYVSKTVPAERLVQVLDRVMQGECVIETPLATSEPATKLDYFWLKFRLTPREMEILKGIKQGLTTKQMATQFNLSYHTVHAHRRNINHKLPFKTEQEFYNFLDTMED